MIKEIKIHLFSIIRELFLSFSIVMNATLIEYLEFVHKLFDSAGDLAFSDFT